MKGKVKMPVKEMFKYFVASLAAVVTAWQFYSFGRNDGKEMNQVMVDFYKAKLEDSTKMVADSLGQVTSLKLELQKSVEFAKVRDSSPVNVNALADLLKKSPRQGMSVSLEAGTTKTLFDDGLYVSLVAISYNASMPSHSATIVVGSPGKKPLRVENAEVGTVANYEGYEVRVVAASTFSVGIEVSKLETEKSQ